MMMTARASSRSVAIRWGSNWSTSQKSTSQKPIANRCYTRSTRIIRRTTTWRAKSVVRSRPPFKVPLPWIPSCLRQIPASADRYHSTTTETRKSSRSKRGSCKMKRTRMRNCWRKSRIWSESRKKWASSTKSYTTTTWSRRTSWRPRSRSWRSRRFTTMKFRKNWTRCKSNWTTTLIFDRI